MYEVTDAEPKRGQQRYRVKATCDKCGKLFLDHNTYNKPDTTQKTYCMQCEQEMHNE